MRYSKRRILVWLPLTLGAALFILTLTHVDVAELAQAGARLGVALPLVLLLSGAWHVLRTASWACCLPPGSGVPFRRLFRVRLAAEAFSYTTISGLAGEPVKVLLLGDAVRTDIAVAAVTFERLAYIVVTTALVGVTAGAALLVLPLASRWRLVFEWFGIAAAVLVFLAGMAVRGDGTYVDRVLASLSHRTRGRLGAGAVAQLLIKVERRLFELARGDRRRLAKLVALEGSCYALMAGEIWVVLRAVGSPVPLTSAFAAETFTRVVSLLSAAIPANLGTLEASQMLAASLIGIGSGGPALALARRFRGLFWAAAGFLVYPRGKKASAAAGPTLAYFPEDQVGSVSPATRIGSLPIAERVIRAASRGGYARLIVWAPRSGHLLGRLISGRDFGLSIVVVSDEEQWREQLAKLPDPFVTVIGPGTVVAPAVLRNAQHRTAAPRRIVEVPAGPAWPSSGVFRMSMADAANPDFVLRQIRERRVAAHHVPGGVVVSRGDALLTLRVNTPNDREVAERILRRSIFKPTDSLLARFNRRVSLPISLLLVRTPITANQLSVALVGMGFWAAWLFSRGTYAADVEAATVSLAASILDGCDGEIARLKYEESAFGCWLETLGDYAYYLAIFSGITMGVVRGTGSWVFYPIGGVALAGALLTFSLLIVLRRRITQGKPERLQATTRAHYYEMKRWWASLLAEISVCATRSTMPYGILVFALFGWLPAIVVLAAIGASIYWIGLTVRLRVLLHESERVRPVAAA